MSFTAKIFNNAVSSLNAQQGVIANTANNIANVNTEGYARRVADLQTRLSANSGSLNLGSGVELAGITRINNEFLDGLVRSTAAEANDLQVQDEYLQRAEVLFTLSGDNVTIGQALSEFYAAIDNLSVNPASIELRSDMLERGQDLVNAIKQTYGGLATLQAEADERLAVEIDTVNSLTSQIATLNGLVAAKELTGVAANDERDQRDQLLKQLSEKIGYDMLEGGDGQVSVTLGNGFPLVTGVNSRQLEVTNNPSFADPADNPYLLDGSAMSFVVYDYDSGVGSSHLNLTDFVSDGGGVIGGLLKVRGSASAGDVGAFSADGPLVEMAARVESVTRILLTTFNETYRGPDIDAGTAGLQPSARDLDGNIPAVFGFFDFTGSSDADADGIAEATDLNTIIYGNGGTGTEVSLSRLLELTSSDPREVAAGRIDAVGETISEGDADNLAALSDLQTTEFTFAGTIGNGANQAFLDRTTTFNSFYNETVGRVGNLKARSLIDYNVAQDNHLTAVTRREEVSGVSLDEEFTSLIRFQKAFEANARIIRIGEEMLDNIIALL